MENLERYKLVRCPGWTLPERLEQLLESEFPKLQGSLDSSQASGLMHPKEAPSPSRLSVQTLPVLRCQHF